MTTAKFNNPKLDLDWVPQPEAHKVSFNNKYQDLNEDYSFFLRKNGVNERRFLAPVDFGTFEQPYMKIDIGRMLKEIISVDRDLESLKQILSLKTDFNIQDCFRVFDVQGNKSVNLRQIEETYTFFQVYPQREELELLILRYDTDCDGRLS